MLGPVGLTDGRKGSDHTSKLQDSGQNWTQWTRDRARGRGLCEGAHRGARPPWSGGGVSVRAGTRVVGTWLTHCRADSVPRSPHPVTLVTNGKTDFIRATEGARETSLQSGAQL